MIVVAATVAANTEVAVPATEVAAAALTDSDNGTECGSGSISCSNEHINDYPPTGSWLPE